MTEYDREWTTSEWMGYDQLKPYLDNLEKDGERVFQILFNPENGCVAVISWWKA